MASDDGAWVFDTLIGFLQGPVWSAPILTFVEEKSAIFDAQFGADSEEEYQKIHEDYKSLVDTILGSLMEELGITAEQFEKACSLPPPEGALPQFHKSLFEQVWAANDYQIFRRMMMQKNVELQLQTLEMIRQQSGAIPECCRPVGDAEAGDAEGGDLLDPVDADEAQILDEVLRRSLAEVDATADEQTRALQLRVAAPQEVQRLRAEVARGRRQLSDALSHTLEAEVSAESEAAAEEEEEQREAAAEEPTKDDEAESPEQRRAYLQAQRDRLLSLKKVERQRLLREKAPAGSDGAARPRSAHATAARALDGHARPVSARTLAVRRALAERLRGEVVGGR